MKRVKREKTSRAFSKGYTHGIQGHSRNLSPFDENSQNHQMWMSGWREGRADLWSGNCATSTFKRVAL
ncbi:MAG: ribosome modulation factor [Pseudomonadota bacterium]|nr:ribosome modulation factor [Gammaproteobacteria bacterium]MEC8009279.1 ribosome modulation factor [Pseudomonadota bacterium]HBF08797.1 ribosome modulation factor [Gammaproteobacteria bacterium]|tara:strand:+ start:336 stop:539 length:204 start_codon:yes stop_codon:yes gene_type:complete